MNYRIDNLQYCKWSREIFEINNKAGLNAVHVTLVYHEDYDELQQRIKEWNKHFEENKDLIFTPENLNKMEAALGKAWRTNMEDVLERMKTGTNKPSWARGNNWEADMLDFMSGSVSGIMFLNMRSAILQQVSIPNYINITDNNIIQKVWNNVFISLS